MKRLVTTQLSRPVKAGQSKKDASQSDYVPVLGELRLIGEWSIVPESVLRKFVLTFRAPQTIRGCALVVTVKPVRHFLVADFISHACTLNEISFTYSDTKPWGHVLLLITARPPEYCGDIWYIPVTPRSVCLPPRT